MRNSDVDYRLLEAAKAGDLDTVKVDWLHFENDSLTLLPVGCYAAITGKCWRL